VKEILWKLLLAGGAGGAVGWVYAEIAGHRIDLAPLWAIGASVVLGAGAALIGLMLANPDRTDVLRAVAFAFACGVFWRPVYEAGAAYIARLPEVKSETKAADAAKKLDETLAGLSALPPGSPGAPAEVALAGRATAGLVAAAGKVKDADLRAEYEKRAAAAVEAIARVDAPAEQKAAVLSEVGRQAAESGQTDVALEAVRGLDAAVATASSTKLQALRERTLTELQGSADAKNDLRLRRAVDESRKRPVGPS
jgi:hypothetical protein